VLGISAGLVRSETASDLRTIAALGNVPVRDLLIILLAMPAFAAIVGWLFAGREPAAMAHQPIE
jgi:hypothetical protein